MPHTATHNDFLSGGIFDTSFQVPTAPYSSNYQGTYGSPQEFDSFQPIPDFTSAGLDQKSKFDLFGQGGANLAAGIGAVGSLGNAFAAYKQYKLGKDTLAQNKAAFNLNLSNQAKVTNAQIEDRALRRAAQRSDITGDLDAIQAAADRTLQARKVDDTPI